MSINEKKSSTDATNATQIDFRAPYEGDASECSITLETSFKGFCVQAKLDDNGNIRNNLVKKSMTRYRKDIEEELTAQGFNLGYKKALIQFFYLILTAFSCLTQDIVIISIAFGFLVFMMYTDGFNAVSQWIALAIISFKNKKMRKFHAAEHMTLSAYERYKRIPTIEEVKQEKRFSSVCGSNILSENALLAFVGSIILTLAIVGCVCFCVNTLPNLITIPRLLMLGFGILLYIILVKQTLEYIVQFIEYGFSTNKLTHIFQRPFVGKASDTEIKVAISALETYEAFEKNLKMHPHDYMIKKITFDMDNYKILVYLFNNYVVECSFEEYSEVVTNNAIRASGGQNTN